MDNKPTTNYKPISVDQKPEKEGYYYTFKEGKDNGRLYWTGTEWRYYKNVPHFNSIEFDHWLLPVPDSIILTQGELEAVWDEIFGTAGYYPKDKQTYINNLLTGK